MDDLRVGLGFDLHGPDPDRPLRLAGVPFEGEPGLGGHSDGDVISHAVADALLGAAAMGDLGDHFPDTAPEAAGMAGLELLSRVVGMLRERRLAVRTCDLTFVGERPHLAARRDEMRRNLGSVLRVADERVSVKATRPEGLGLTGDGAGCLAVVSVGPAGER
jgi:2-C-methyl-D-erythritol 2,4-cyclodiphosphate synthase